MLFSIDGYWVAKIPGICSKEFEPYKRRERKRISAIHYTRERLNTILSAIIQSALGVGRRCVIYQEFKFRVAGGVSHVIHLSRLHVSFIRFLRSFLWGIVGPLLTLLPLHLLGNGLSPVLLFVRISIRPDPNNNKNKQTANKQYHRYHCPMRSLQSHYQSAAVKLGKKSPSLFP